MDYKKLPATFKERVTFLFTGLLPKKYIVEEQTISFPQTAKEQKLDINNKEETKTVDTGLKMDIPFFDLDTSKTKSNL